MRRATQSGVARKPQYSIRTLLLVTVVVAIPTTAVSYVIQRRNAWLAEVRRRAEQDEITIRQIVLDVDDVCTKLGRAPRDQTELESILGKPLPNVHDNGHPTPIHYWKTGEMSYNLQYELWATDDWVYDSTTPHAGWVQHWY